MIIEAFSQSNRRTKFRENTNSEGVEEENNHHHLVELCWRRSNGGDYGL
jgi:hypothetical protein